MIERINTNEFKAELVRLLANETSGFTFDLRAGSIVRRSGEPYDVVTLASVNVSPVGLTLGTIADALAPFAEIVSLRFTVPFYVGLFSFFDKTGEEAVSVDLNVLVHQAFRANTMEFACLNNQVAIYDCRRAVCIPTGGSGDTLLQGSENIFKAAEALVDGRPIHFEMPGGKVISAAAPPQGPGHKWHKTVTPVEGPYQYINRQGQVLGECDHTTRLTAFGECWWKCRGQQGRLPNLRQCRQHIEELVQA